MRTCLAALMFCLTISPAWAQTQPAPVAAPAADAAADGVNWLKIAAVSIGAVSGLVAIDLLTGGTLTAPVVASFSRTTAAATATTAAATTTGSTALTVAAAPAYSPAVLEARAAGAVLGEMILPATNIRDQAARADLLWVAALGIGALGGASLVNWAVSEH